MTQAKTWTVYSAVGQVVIATVWNEDGPQPNPATVAGCTSEAEASERATEFQRSYDALREAMVAE